MRLRFADVAQSDLAAKARAFRSFADGWVPVAAALRLAGLEGMVEAADLEGSGAGPGGNSEG